MSTKPLSELIIIVNSTFKNTLLFFFQEKEVENVVSIMAAICLSLNVLNDNDSDTVFRMPSGFIFCQTLLLTGLLTADHVKPMCHVEGQYTPDVNSNTHSMCRCSNFS